MLRTARTLIVGCIFSATLALPFAARAQSVQFTGDFGGSCVSTAIGSQAGGIAVDPTSGNVVVMAMDIASPTFRSEGCIFGPDGTFLGVLTDDGVTPHAFAEPMGVAIDPDTGAIVAIDYTFGSPRSGSVKVFDASGKLSATQLTFADGDPGFDDPTGVAIDASTGASRGQIIVTDPSNISRTPAVRVFNAINPADTAASAGGVGLGAERIQSTGVVASPLAVATDRAGNIWVTDGITRSVIEFNANFDPGSKAVLTASGGFTPPAFQSVNGLAIDPASGTLALADSVAATISIFAAPSAPPSGGLIAAPAEAVLSGAGYSSLGGVSSTGGGQNFDNGGGQPLVFPVAFNKKLSLLAGQASPNPVQQFQIIPLAGPVPALGDMAAVFAAMLLVAGLILVRRRAV